MWQRIQSLKHFQTSQHVLHLSLHPKLVLTLPVLCVRKTVNCMELEPKEVNLASFPSVLCNLIRPIPEAQKLSLKLVFFYRWSFFAWLTCISIPL
jgi:hypothetical protein